MRAPTAPAGEEPGQPTSILVSGGSPLGRSALVSRLDREAGFTVVGHGPHSADMGRLAAEHSPHVAVVIADPDPMPTIRSLTAGGGPVPRVLVVSPCRRGRCGQHLPSSLPEVAGLAGITVNLADQTAVVPAIRLLRSGYRVCPAPAGSATPPGTARSAHAWEELARLTGRETEVVHLMLRGWTNAEIAEALTLSGATVKSHVHSLMGKLELRSRVDVITTAYTTGFVGPR